MGPEIGRRLRELRAARGLSLTELARRADVGKGTLSEIETGKRNPTVETLYAVCRPLDVPISALLGEERGSDGVAEGGMRTVLLSVRRLPHATVEVFRLEFPAGADHTSPGHGAGVAEHLTVVAGALRVGPLDAEVDVAAGATHTWDSSAAHRYAALEGPGEAVLVITTPA